MRRLRPAISTARYSVDAAANDLGADLVGRRIQYWWPEDGWQLGTVAQTCRPRASSFSHVVAYHRRTSALRGTVESLLDAASYGTRWVLLSALPPAGVERAARVSTP